MRTKSAISHWRIAKPIRIMALSLVAALHLSMVASPVDSLVSLLKAYDVDKELDDTQPQSDDLNAIATIYLNAQHSEYGIKVIEKAIELERKAKRDERLAIRLGTAAELYLMHHEVDKADKAIDEAIDIGRRLGKGSNVAMWMTTKASILENKSEYHEALELLMQAQPILEQAGDAYSMAVCYNRLGDVCEKLSRHDEAINYYKKALQQSIKCGSSRAERDAERGLWETLRDEKPAVAMLHLERYTTLTDSIYSQMASIHSISIETLPQHIESSKLSNTSRALIKWGGLLLLILSLAMIFGLFYIWRKSKLALKMQKQTQMLRDHFFNNITKELHTPLTIIMSAGHQLVEEQKISHDTKKHIGGMIIKHGNKMLSLVNQLLDIEKVKTNIEKPELKPGDIVMFVRMLVDNFTEQAHERMLNIEFFSPLTSMVVVFAPDYIRQIVHLLVKNAIEYTPRNGQIKVSLEMLDDSRFQLTVADTGKGIPIEERNRVFEPFSQQDDGSEGIKTGLELSFVNLLVQTINGHVDIQSELDHGTTITITFPVQKSDSTVVESLTARPHFDDKDMLQSSENKQRPLVFIVENTEDVSYFIANHLRDKYNIRMAQDGREAFRNAQDMVPDLIITNIMMPVMGGMELIRRLRTNPALNHIPIIAMTSNTSEQERLACIEAGADAVLVKPFNSTELKLLANHLITQRNALRERFISSSDNETDNSVSQMSKEDKEFIHKLVEVIQAQMAKDDIDMEHIAAALSLSRKQLRTRVMTLTGLTPVAYVLQVRLNYARRMIVSEDTSLTTIASKCGFQNLSHFSKAFKQQFGVSPLQFRKSTDSYRQADH